VTLVLPLLVLFQFAATPHVHIARHELPHITANDNRHPAGVLRDGVLTLRLVAQDGLFFPDGEQGKSFALQAFGEEGKAPTASAPLIRVPAGTEVRVAIRNALGTPLMVRGLYDRASAAPDSADVAPGGAMELRFRASVPGTYFYWGRTTGKRRGIASGEDGQLLGAFIVDPPMGTTPVLSDRVMVITNWFKPADTRKPDLKPLEILTVNGHSWPFTERLAYSVSDSIHWRVINGSFIWHPMHLHGFYYRVDSRGDGLADTAYTARQQRTVVTEWMGAGSTMTMTWSPSRPGNWLFHCHLAFHIASDVRLTPANEHASGHEMNHATDGMAGLVMGIVVKPRPGQRVQRQDALPPEKTLRLYVNSRANVFGTSPGYGFVLQEGPNAPAPDSIRIPGTPIQLIRGERTQITVVNRSPVPVTVHWHGIELESYYDGVGGWSGADARVAPMIAPNDSFVVRMTPDRAGTFIYHTHADESGQLGSGLYGPLLITERGQPVDTATNRIFLLGIGGPGDNAPPWVNGSADPAPLTLDRGRTYRFRLINITPNGQEDVVLRADSVVQQWRAFAKDGATLPEWQATMRPAKVHMGAGETTDFEFTPSQAGELVLESTVRSLGIPAKTVRQRLILRLRNP
jgi:FtsP/CotA-like multicopper oxidase with cupredoxin domain